jgi:hypothetical protein
LTSALATPGDAAVCAGAAPSSQPQPKLASEEKATENSHWRDCGPVTAQSQLPCSTATDYASHKEQRTPATPERRTLRLGLTRHESKSAEAERFVEFVDLRR